MVQHAAGRIPIIAGTGANSTAEAIELTAAAQSLGVDACLLVTPYYNKPTQEGLYRHYKAIAEAVDIPQWLYNVPSRTALDLLPETIARLAKIERITAVKEATGDLKRGQEVLRLCGEEIAVYSGDDATAIDFILMGAQGNISVTANVAPQAMHDACLAALQGDSVQAQALNQPLVGLHQALFLESNPIPVKWALNYLQKIDSGIRLPLTVLSQSHHLSLQQALDAAGLSK